MSITEARPTADDVPDDVKALVGVEQYEEAGEFPVERGYFWTVASSVENANPLFWDDEVATELTGGPIAPPTMISAWFRPHHWAPGRTEQKLPLQVHFDLKAMMGLPEAIMSENTLVFFEPVRPGDMLSTAQILRSVSGVKTLKIGTGRFWDIDVEYRNQRGELCAQESITGFGYNRPEGAVSGDAASGGEPSGDGSGAHVGPGTASTRAAGTLTVDRLHVGDELPELAYDVTATTVVLGAIAMRDWRPMHHDYKFATEHNGTRDIFLNTPNQAHWFERFMTDWTGPRGRLGRMKFRMKSPVFPGETMVFRGIVTGVETDATGCGWADVDVALRVGARLCTTCAVRIAIPTTPDDNPWARRAERWNP